MKKHAPLDKADLQQIIDDIGDIRAAAKRKNVTLDTWDECRELRAAKEHFDLGCWFFHYRFLVGSVGEEGFRARVDCARRSFLEGIFNPGYKFFTLFDFGERHFDTLFEMGDAERVIAELRKLISTDKSGKIAEAFDNFGWPKHVSTVESDPAISGFRQLEIGLAESNSRLAG